MTGCTYISGSATGTVSTGGSVAAQAATLSTIIPSVNVTVEDSLTSAPGRVDSQRRLDVRPPSQPKRDLLSTITDFNALAAAQVGVPYVFGGVNLKGTPHPGLDCSGLPYAVSLALGQSIPRTSEAQYAGLPAVTFPRRGDLELLDVPEDTQPQPAHVTIWWDANTRLQAPRTGEDVQFSPPLPYRVMGYRRLPFPDAAPVLIPPLPVPIKEETMSLQVKPDGSIVISAVGAGSRNQHLMVFTLNNPFNPSNPGYNVIDVTNGIGTSDPYTVESA